VSFAWKLGQVEGRGGGAGALSHRTGRASVNLTAEHRQVLDSIERAHRIMALCVRIVERRVSAVFGGPYGQAKLRGASPGANPC